MKILYILPVLLFCKISLAQDIPEIPMKNDLVYYEFKHTLKNTGICISKYNFKAALKIPQKLTAKLSTINNGLVCSFQTPVSRKNNLYSVDVSCQDTLNVSYGGGFQVIIPAKKNVLSDNPLFHISKAQIYSQDITAIVEIVYVSKNEYILKFKDFQYNVTSAKSFQTAVIEQVPLGEFYNHFLTTEKKSKEQIELFNTLNLFLNSIDAVYLEALTELYKADEL